MLKAELIRARLVIQGNRVWTRPLPVDYHYLSIAAGLLALFQKHVGCKRGELDQAFSDYEGDSLDYPIIRGLAAVIETRCAFSGAPPVPPADVRARLFRYGPVTVSSDLFSTTTRADAVAQVAVELRLTPVQVEDALLADLPEEQTLIETGDPLEPAGLIARYNLELARGVLYWAREMRLTVRDGYKDVFKFLKLFKLMYTVSVAQPNGYHVTLYGPISPFVKSTLRYGLQFAKFLPALLLCSSWQMEADIQLPGVQRVLRYTLDERAGLETHFKSSGPFDSRLEADFAAEFEARYGGARRKWTLAREDELILLGDTVMIPDFSFTHQDGRRALLEIVGYWHPDYLRRKLDKVRQAQRRDLILLVYESANVAAGKFDFKAASAGEVLTFKSKPVLKDVLAALERCAAMPDSVDPILGL